MFQLTTSRRGRQDFCKGCKWARNVSTHDLTKRSTVIELSFASSLVFQLTTSRRGRLPTKLRFLSLQMFQLTTSRRGRRIRATVHGNLRVRFNSRPHEEVDQKRRRNGAIGLCFNSRPHEEVDRADIDGEGQRNVSTHDLTKRSTAIFTQKVFLSKSLFVLIAYNIFILH